MIWAPFSKRISARNWGPSSVFQTPSTSCTLRARAGSERASSTNVMSRERSTLCRIMQLFLHLQSDLALEVVLYEPLLRVSFDRITAGDQDLPLHIGILCRPGGPERHGKHRDLRALVRLVCVADQPARHGEVGFPSARELRADVIPIDQGRVHEDPAVAAR